MKESGASPLDVGFESGVRPAGWVLLALLSFALVVLSAWAFTTAPPPGGAGWVAGPVILGIFGVACVWMAWHSACRLRITDRIEHRAARTLRTLELDRALRVQVHRSLIQPSAVEGYLVVNDGGVERRLQFSAYLLFGVGAEARTRRLAELLGLSVEDPRGDRWRASSFFLVRWLGQGRLWAWWLALTLVALPIVGGILLVVRS